MEGKRTTNKNVTFKQQSILHFSKKLYHHNNKNIGCDVK